MRAVMALRHVCFACSKRARYTRLDVGVLPDMNMLSTTLDSPTCVARSSAWPGVLGGVPWLLAPPPFVVLNSRNSLTAVSTSAVVTGNGLARASAAAAHLMNSCITGLLDSRPCAYAATALLFLARTVNKSGLWVVVSRLW